MLKKKNVKIPYQEYQAFKDQEARKKFRLTWYPWPVLAVLLVPAAIFIFSIIYYITVVMKIPE